MESIITPNVLKWLADTISNYHCQLSPFAPDWTTESDHAAEREPSSPPLLHFIKQGNESDSIAHEQIPIGAHTMAYEEGFGHTMEMVVIL
jgi:hypothetical protein